jgi:putative aldouronate transport system substrate-binding protein
MINVNKKQTAGFRQWLEHPARLVKDRRKIMKKRIWAVLLAALMVAAVFAGCGSEPAAPSEGGESGGTAAPSEGGSEEPYDVTFMYVVGGDHPDQAKVEEAMKALVLEELNMNLNVVTVPSTYSTQLMLMLTSGEALDVFPMPADGSGPLSYITNGYIQDLGPLLDLHGDKVEAIYGDESKIANIDGFVFAIPMNKERDYAGGMIMRKDILDQCGIDVGENCSKLTKLEDMTAVFAAVHEKFPDMTVFGGDYIYTPASIFLGRGIDNLGNEFGVLLDPAENTTVTNWYESDEYIRRVNLMREWYQAGYVQKDMATSTDSGTTQMRAGNLFCDFDLTKPYRAVEAEQATGFPCVCFDFDEPVKNSCTVLDGWSIASNSENPEKAMEFLNWVYGSAEFNNLMNWGIEGEHFVYVDKGNSPIVDFPEGKDLDSVGYHQNRGWELPNQYIAGIWAGNPEDLPEAMAKYNKDMKISKAYGFIFNGADYETELANLNSVREKYAYALGSGSVDPETELAKFNAELYAAGLQTIMDAKQEQLDAWLASK